MFQIRYIKNFGSFDYQFLLEVFTDNSSQFVIIAPPSPKHPNVFAGKKLNVPAIPNVPANCSLNLAPKAWQESSTINKLFKLINYCKIALTESYN